MPLTVQNAINLAAPVLFVVMSGNVGVKSAKRSFNMKCISVMQLHGSYREKTPDSMPTRLAFLE
jgi:hypothetical protein